MKVIFDIISIGDATEDVFLELEEAKVHCEQGSRNCVICFHYADKIPVKNVHNLVGGNAANNAVGSSRLGLKTAFYCELGDDDQGEKIYNALKSDRVAAKYVFLRKGVSTNYSVVLDFHAERTIFIYHVKRKYSLPKFDRSRWLYYTSMGVGFEKIHPALEKYVKRNKVKLAFNPGTHQLRSGLKKIGKILKLSEVVFLNKEETQLLTSSNSDDFKVLLKKLRGLGPKIAVVTDGPKGSYAYDGKDFYFLKIFDAPIVERTGCGDSYSTAFVAALSYGCDVKEAMRWGTINAASVIQKIGPQAGLMKLNDMKRILAKHPKFQPVKI